MSQASLVREWAKTQGYEVGVRGRIAPAIWQAYSDAHGGVERELPDRGAIATCTCGRRWAGLRECHCRTCHRHFSTVTNFDWHVPGTCLDPLTVTNRKGEVRMQIRDSVWGPIYVQAGEHYLSNTYEGKADE